MFYVVKLRTSRSTCKDHVRQTKKSRIRVVKIEEFKEQYAHFGLLKSCKDLKSIGHSPHTALFKNQKVKTSVSRIPYPFFVSRGKGLTPFLLQYVYILIAIVLKYKHTAKFFILKRNISIMPRRRTPKKRTLTPDPVYDSRLVHTIVNHLMKEGKKSLAYKIFYDAMEQIKNTTQQDPVKVIEQAVRNATPLVEVKAKRIGGSTYQVPLAVKTERGTALSIRWLLASCRSRSGRSMISKVTNEFIEASKNTGNAIRKRDEVHRMAEANKAFAKYRF